MALPHGHGQRIVLPPGAVPLATEPRYVPPPTGCTAHTIQWTIARPAGSAAVIEPVERDQELPAAIRAAIDDLQEVPGCGALRQVLHMLGRSETEAYLAAVNAARALAEFNARTTQLRAHPDSLRRAKRAGLLVRDRVIWRCLGYQGAFLDSQRVQQLVFSHISRTDTASSQLTNAYQSIMAELLQDLVLSDAWRRLINSLRLHPSTEDAQAILTKLVRTYLECPFLRPQDDDALPRPPSGGTSTAELHFRPMVHADAGCGLPSAIETANLSPRPGQLGPPPGHHWLGYPCWPSSEQPRPPMPTTQHKVNDSTVEAVLALILASPDPEVVAQLCDLMLTFEVPESAIKARCIQPLTQGLFQLAGCPSVNEPACLGMLCVLAVYVGPSLPGQLLGTAESLTLELAPLVLRAWGFGAYVACRHVQSLDSRWTDAETVGHPLATLAEAVSDVSVLCGLMEALVAVLDQVSCPCCAGAQRLCTLACTSLVRLGENPSCSPHRLGSAAQDALHALRRSRRLFGIQLLPGGDHEAVDCCPLLLSKLEKLVYQTDDFQALLLRVLARAHTASEVIKVVCRSQPGRAPLMLGTVVQEAVLGLRPVSYTHLRAHET